MSIRGVGLRVGQGVVFLLMILCWPILAAGLVYFVVHMHEEDS